MDDVRPYFGERSEPLGDESLSWYTPQPQPRSAFEHERIEARVRAAVEEGMCPWDMARLDEGACVVCGKNPLVWLRERDRTPEQHDEYVTTIPGALQPQLQFVDEYAAANLDDEAA